MKIVYITSSSFIDSDFPLIKELVRKGNEVHLFLNIYPNELRTTLLDIREQYPKEGVFDSSIYGESVDYYKTYLDVKKIYIVNRLSAKFLGSSRSLYKEEIKIIDSITPDVVHHIAWPSFVDIPMMYRYKNKMVITIHDPIPHEINRSSKFFRWLRVFASRQIHHYILLNKNQTDYFCKYYHKKKL